VSPRRPTWAERLACLCLLAWPRAARAKHGPGLVQAMLDQLDERGRGPGRLWWIVGEFASLLTSGTTLRLRGARRTMMRWGIGLGVDARIAARSLRRNLGFTVAAVGTLAVGIGGTVAVLDTVDRVLFAPPPYEQPHRLGLVWNTLGDDSGRIRMAAPDVAALRDQTRQLDGVAFIHRVTDASFDPGTVDGDAVEHARLAAVTHDFFDVLGVAPTKGRGFTEADGPLSGGAVGPLSGGAVGTETAGSPVALLTHAFWRSRLGADPGALGRTVRLNGRPTRVVGVLPPDFRLELPPDAGVAVDADVWTPLRIPLSAVRRQEERLLDQDSDNTGVAVARLRDDVGFEAAAAELARVWRGVRRDVPAYETADLRIDLRPMTEDARQHVRGVFLVLSLGALILLLVTCLNIATLVVARTARRSSELSVRLALGSGRGALARALCLENLLVVVLGAGAALLFAGVLSGRLEGALPPELSSLLGGRTRIVRLVLLAGGVAMALLTTLVVLPARRLGVGGGSVGLRPRRGSGTRVRAVLVGAQVGLSVALMTSSLLIARSAERVREERPGFDARGALTFSLSVRVPDRYSGPAERARLMAEIEAGVASLPGVEAVGLVGGLPLSGDRWTQPYGLPGQAEHEWPENRADFRVVTSGLFDALGVRLLDGRGFTSDEDIHEDRRVVVVDEAMADRVAAWGSAVGRTVGFPLDGNPVHAEIVGVVERVRYDDLAGFGREALYVPYRQEASRDVSFVVRSSRASEAALRDLAGPIRGVVEEVDPELPVYDVRTMTDYVDSAQAPVHFALWLVGAFAALTLLAASVGVYGVVSYEAASREGDLGLRMAVGASAAEVRGLMLRRGLIVGIVGGGAGLVLCAAGVALTGWWTTPAPTSPFPLVNASDPVPWLGGSVVAVGLTILASWWPAHRAGQADPVVALRAE